MQLCPHRSRLCPHVRVPRLAALFAFLLFAATSIAALPPDNRITLCNGQRIFVAGFNLAWINYAADVGDQGLDTAAFRDAVRKVSGSGGNALRVWLSTNGANDPRFGRDGLVSGLGRRTIANVQSMFKIAAEGHILLIPTLLTHNFMQRQEGVGLERNRRLLTTDEGLDAYIQKALIPLVSAIGPNPNLLCWEIANEPEGMVDLGGWTDGRITRLDVQRFTNRMAGAIKRAVPGVLVSTGTVTADRLSWYADDALIAAGGDRDGTLDFYMVHYYGWNGPDNSPFTHPASSWKLDKPLVVGEFPSSDWSPETRSSNRMYDSGAVNDCLPILYDSGYAGGLFWQYQRDGGDPWLLGFRTAGPALQRFTDAHRGDTALR